MKELYAIPVGHVACIALNKFIYFQIKPQFFVQSPLSIIFFSFCCIDNPPPPYQKLGRFCCSNGTSKGECLCKKNKNKKVQIFFHFRSEGKREEEQVRRRRSQPFYFGFLFLIWKGKHLKKRERIKKNCVVQGTGGEKGGGIISLASCSELCVQGKYTTAKRSSAGRKKKISFFLKGRK